MESTDRQKSISEANAPDDKIRILQYVKGPAVVEVGSGSGMVLDMLENLDIPTIIGIESSPAVYRSLSLRQQVEEHRWNIIHADALEMESKLSLPCDTFIFCSVLHEIYSYNGFNIEPVYEVLGKAYRMLRPGGRIIIRDGVKPDSRAHYKVIKFKNPKDMKWFLEYRRDFKGSTSSYNVLSNDLVALSSDDAMEFLYTYTWGYSSYPYEVREQYGITTLNGFSAMLNSACPECKIICKESYLQQGYIDNLKDKIEFLEWDNAKPTRLPDSNCLIVIEKG